MKLSPALFPVFAALAFAFPAAAHEAAKGPNGGQVADAGNYHLELVARGDALEAFVFDAADKPLTPAGFKATALLVIEGKTQRISLEPSGNRLAGKATVTLPTSPKGAVQLTAPDGKTASARFN
jgi:hypothetical protein